MSNPYDEVLYPGHPFNQTHPERLATLASLFGMQPARSVACRVLELGCGDGGNLIPMAYALQGSEFVGLDNGARGVANGQEFAGDLGLSNIRLLCRDILDPLADLGTFDYILAHGVYSWVPPHVADRILAICRENLNPQGVAYISYSAYPGAHIRTMMAEMLQYHARRFESPQQQIGQARAMLRFLMSNRPEPDAYSFLLRQEAETVAARRPESLYHDELSENQSPVYFHEFAARAAAHELQYLGESEFSEMQESSESPEVAATLRSLAGNLIDKEQYMDFLKCRRFRQTLLCHREVPLNRRIDSAQMRRFHVRAWRILLDPKKIPTDHPVAQAATAVLKEASPAALPFDVLLDAVRERTGRFDDDEAILADVILAFYACGLYQLYVDPPQFARQADDRPRASAVARRQAATGEYVTTLSHEWVHVEDDLARRLLTLLDGTRNRPAILGELRASGAPDARLEELESSLERLAKLALLEA